MQQGALLAGLPEGQQREPRLAALPEQRLLPAKPLER